MQFRFPQYAASDIRLSGLDLSGTSARAARSALLARPGPRGPLNSHLGALEDGAHTIAHEPFGILPCVRQPDMKAHVYALTDA